MDYKYLMSSLGYAIVGLLLGIYMAASKDHGQFVTHAHIMLIGFLLSFAYGVCHKLWLKQDRPGLAMLQFVSHQVGSVVTFIGLFLLYGQHVDAAIIGPVLGVASIIVLIALVLMKVMVIQSHKAER